MFYHRHGFYTAVLAQYCTVVTCFYTFQDDAMHVVYRMRGLLGEATEDMIERLDNDKTDDDAEEIYKLASVMSECGGIEVCYIGRC